jgi:hypothetical protein
MTSPSVIQIRDAYVSAAACPVSGMDCTRSMSMADKLMNIDPSSARDEL